MILLMMKPKPKPKLTKYENDVFENKPTDDELKFYGGDPNFNDGDY